ncbi:MAG: hypothetical protein AABY07_00430 [Nanoarchaeota archaeon]
MVSDKHSNLVCTICGTDIEVPFCCSKQMGIADDILVCSLCGSKEELPICCGKNMKIVIS